MTDGFRVGIVDYGAGNLPSVEQALAVLGVVPVRITAAADIDEVAALVIPGVGAARPAMERLAAAGLIEPIRTWIARGRPLLGICLGLQLLFEVDAGILAAQELLQLGDRSALRLHEEGAQGRAWPARLRRSLR